MKDKIGNQKPEVRIRRANQRDRHLVLAFCRRTFGRWGDYLPEVWDDWIRDRQGMLFVADLGGRPVGVGKITVQRPGEIWLEGLRVDPKFRGQGIGRILQEWAWRKALSLRPKFIRYATGSYNKISQHLGLSYGMRIMAQFDEYTARPWPKTETALVRSDLSELEALRKLFQKSRDAANWKGLFLEGWSAWEFDRQSLLGLIKNKRVYVYYDQGRLAGALAILQSKDGKYLNYCRAAAVDDISFKFLLREGRALAHLLGAKKLEMHLPRSARHGRLVKGTGWHKAMDIWMVILEKRFD